MSIRRKLWLAILVINAALLINQSWPVLVIAIASHWVAVYLAGSWFVRWVMAK